MYKIHYTCLLALLLTCLSQSAFAEGTKELNPQSNDLAMLVLNDRYVQNFAAYGSSNRLYITAKSGERVYIGLSALYDSHGVNISSTPYYFRVKNASGTTVLGPTYVDDYDANITSKSEAVAGPSALGNAGGYSTNSNFYFDPTADGDYYIEFSTDQYSAPSNTTSMYLKYFDITVASNTTSSATAINGRLWSKNWSIRTAKDPNPNGGYTNKFNRPFNGKLYGYSSTTKTNGFTTAVNFANSGFRGLSFNAAFNSTGASNTGSITENRKSLYNQELVNPEYPVFLNNPDPTIWLDATPGQINVSGFSMTCGTPDQITVSATQPGQVELIFDFNNNGIYDANDIIKVTNFTTSGTNAIDWDRRDSNGDTLASGTNVSIIAKYTQGTLHFPMYDVEYNPTGFNIESVRPTTGVNFDGKLYYDDSNFPSNVVNGVDYSTPGTGSPKVQLNGCNTPCHTWTNFIDIIQDSDMGPSDPHNNNTPGYGNLNTINTWWNPHTDIENFNFEVGVCSLNPVEWLSIAGVSKNNQVHLNWATVSETNNSHFEIEKQISNHQFVKIGTVTAQNNATGVSNYSFVDYNTTQQNSLYRIKQVDFTGSFSYSKIISVSHKFSGNSFQVFAPSLYSNSVTIDYSILEQSDVKFEITNMYGHKIYSNHFAQQEKGVYTKTLTLSNKEAFGIYLVTMYKNGQKETKKVLLGN